MGLATVYGVVKQSGGTIWVYSELGVGTTFRAYFPISSQERLAPLNPKAEGKKHLGTGTVLMVEDDDQVRALAAASLTARGYRVFSAQNGEEALKVAADLPVPLDILITDVIMPKMGGPELVGKLSPARPDMLVLYISGYTEHAIVPTGTVPAGIQLLPKPFTPNMLAQKVSEMLARD